MKSRPLRCNFFILSGGCRWRWRVFGCGDSDWREASGELFTASRSESWAASAAWHFSPLAGLVALSAYLPMIERAASDITEQAIEQPLFMAHGAHDPVVPYAAGEYSAAALRRLGFSVEWHRYPMPHSVCAEEVADLGEWLTQRFMAG